jgi:hypothetical protein
VERIQGIQDEWKKELKTANFKKSCEKSPLNNISSKQYIMGI